MTAGFDSGFILDQVETGIIVVDPHGQLRYANRFAETLFSLPEDVQYKNWMTLRSLGFEDDDVGKMTNMQRQVRRGLNWEGTLTVRRQDGSVFFVRANAAPLRSASGEVTGTVVMAREAVQLRGEREFDRMGFLEHIGERMARSLEFESTLRRVAETLVPQFADHCLIDLRGGEMTGSQLYRRAAKHANDWVPPPGTWAAVGEKINYPKGHFCRQAIDQEETVLVEDMMDEEFPAPSQESRQTCENVGLTSVIASPLITRGRTLGVLSLALSSLTDRAWQHYVADDRDMVSAIATRVAIAIDNALLFEEERNTATEFQLSLLPHEPPVLDGLEVAYKYVPAKPLEKHNQGIQTQVGGDWYDIIPLSAGRVGIVIGDVEGRGARAAAFMGQLRSALRAFAQDDKAPADILRRLDEWCKTLVPATIDSRGIPVEDPPLASCTYLIYDPWTRQLTIANAGHQPPLIIADGEPATMAFEHEGLMLGVGAKGIPGVPTYREEISHLAPGATLIFYTDGLTERRHRADGVGHYDDGEVDQMLRQAVQGVAHDSVEAIAAAAQNAVPGQIDDDMAIVVVRTSQADLDEWSQKFAAEPIRVSEARREAFETFIGWGMDTEQADLACLLVSEVVTNVVLHTSAVQSGRHEFAYESASLAALHDDLDDWRGAPFTDDPQGSGQEFTLRIRRGERAIWVEVFDTDLRLPRIRSAGENDEGGRGLYLVDQLAVRWGSRPTEDGKAVWFELPIRSGAITG